MWPQPPPDILNVPVVPDILLNLPPVLPSPLPVVVPVPVVVAVRDNENIQFVPPSSSKCPDCLCNCLPVFFAVLILFCILYRFL